MRGTYLYRLTNHDSLNYIGVNVMQLHRELAFVLENARLCTSAEVGFMRWSRTTVAENALFILAATAILAW
jgi:hypothetical protein